MRALDIQQSLVIHFLCIYEIIGYLAEWAQNNEYGNMKWNVKI